MNSELITALRNLHATNVDGFEGLIAKLLEALTGRHFLLAQAGSQMGRDMSSRSIAQNIIAVECKRYGSNRNLDERELLGELVQAERAFPDLDLWILVASRSVSSQLNESVYSAAQRLGVSYFAISTEDRTPSSLETLCANTIGIVIQHLTENLSGSFDVQRVRNALELVAQLPEFPGRVAQLRETLISPLQGYDNWRVEQQKDFLQHLKSEQEARSCFGQPINVEDENIQLIRREEAWIPLNEWFNQWDSNSKPFILLGEEGDGKTWCAVSWLVDRIKEDPQFPPALFLTSTTVNSNEAETLISEKVASYFSNLNPDQQKKRLNRWMTKAQNDRPLFLLVLDGINERRNSVWWRSLLESLLGRPWCDQVAIVVTCRSDYWRIHNDRFRHFNATDYTLPPYSDEELGKALIHNGLQVSDIHHLEPLIRKPRYLNLVVRYRQRIEESGDLTIARLIYEDWRDRIQRKRNISLNDQEFQSLIASLALKNREKRSYLQKNDIDCELPSAQDKEAVFEELQTGGILENHRRGYKVNEKLLVYGLGLLLAEEVEKATEAQETELSEAIAEWLEPHAEMDIKAAICGFATLHALSLSDYPQEAKIALLNAWVNSLNPGEAIEHDFIAYFPIDPESYIRLAEIVWLTNSSNEWAQEYLMQAFLRWSKKSPRILSHLHSAFENWLGFINIREYEHERQRQINAGIEGVPQEISERIGCAVQVGDRISLGKYNITAIADAGLTRLGRVALAVISHLPKKQFIHEIATGCLAEAIVDTAKKYDLFAWMFRTASEPFWEEVQVEVNCLFQLGQPFALQAAHRLLSFEGSQEAFQLQQALPENLFPSNAYNDRYRQDPCVTRFTWTQADCERCLQRSELTAAHIAHQLKSHCVNPFLQVPNDLRIRLSPLVSDISIDKVELSPNRTSDDGMLEDYEPALCAYAPLAIADLTLCIAREVSTRTGIPLRQISLKLHTDDLIFGIEECNLIYQAWLNLSDRSESWDDEDKLAEAFLFRVILKAQDAETQIRHLIQRPEFAIDLIAFQQSFLAIHDWEFIREQLTLDLSNTLIHRILWHISTSAKEVPQDILNYSASKLLNHDYFLVRVSVLNLIFQSENSEAIQMMIESEWSWLLGQDLHERHWGCLLLCKYGGSLLFSDLRRRIHPIYLGYAIHCRGFKLEELNGYISEINLIQAHIYEQVEEKFFDYSSIFTTASFEADRDLTMLHLIATDEQQFSRSVSFVSPDSCWGGINTDDSSDPLGEALFSDGHQRHNQQQIIKSIQEQQKAGNSWFGERFFSYALLQIMLEQPGLVSKWLNITFIDTPENKRLLCRANSFYESLCGVLLQCNPEQGVHLYWQLQRLDAKIRIRDAQSNLELIDYALFEAIPTDLIEEAWKNKLDQCLTDRQLMRLIVLAELGKGHDWLWSSIEQGLQSSSPHKTICSMRLLAFMPNREALERLDLLLENAPDTWIKDLLEKSRQLWQRNDWCIHWFKRFLNLEDNVEAWAAFKLFLACVDTRFWLWQEQLKAGSKDFSWSAKRLLFLEDNLNTIQNKIRNNEKDLDKYLFGHKVLSRQVYPWM